MTESENIANDFDVPHGDVVPVNDFTGIEEELVTRRRCTATSKQSQQRCKRSAILGGSVCFTHGGAAPQVQRKARERLLELVEPALVEMTKIVLNKSTPPNVKLAAIKDILDRSGLGAVQKIEADISIYDTREALLREIEEILENNGAGSVSELE